jgi:glucosamine--fructose-6-phosphate aminotransferase (isomerizing)
VCGIIGVVREKKISLTEPVEMLKRLEYRGYDSFGFASNTGFLEKSVGQIGRYHADPENKSRVFIGHTRWATHGLVTEKNAHPHTSCNGEVMIVHNGIIENYEDLKKELESKGHKFISQTDSEVIAHFFEEALKNKMSMKEAMTEFMNKFKGTFAILVVRKGDDRIYALKRFSPLVIGLTKSGFVIASDIYAFSNKTNKAIFFNDNEFAIISDKKYRFFNSKGKEIEKEAKVFDWTEEHETKKKFKHYMIKEINDQPKATKRLLKSLKTTQKTKIRKMKTMIQKADKVMFVCAGTSYHASLLGVYFLKRAGIDAQSVIASEFENFATVDKNTLVIPITQSGETMDVIKALDLAKSKGCKIASLVNVPFSTIQRMSDLSIDIFAGHEVCVASTKSFTNQVVILLHIASLLGYKTDISDLPKRIIETIEANENKIKQLSDRLYHKRDIYVIGRGMSYPVALETALKIKEISYIHAEGMMGGELKHGTLALVESGTPVISFIFNKEHDMVSSTKEVESRGARTIIISNKAEHTDAYNIKIPSNDRGVFAILSTVVGQMLTYYIALKKGLPIDKPRNLAKSVTVK